MPVFPLGLAASQSSILQFLRPLSLKPAVAPIAGAGGGPPSTAPKHPANGVAHIVASSRDSGDAADGGANVVDATDADLRTVWFSESPLSAGAAEELNGSGVIPSAATANDGGGQHPSSSPSDSPRSLVLAPPSSGVITIDDTSDDGAGNAQSSALAGLAVGGATTAVSDGGHSSRKQAQPRRGRSSVRNAYDDVVDAVGTGTAVTLAAPHARRRRVITDDEADVLETDPAVAPATALFRRRRIIDDADDDAVVPHALPHARRHRSIHDDDGTGEEALDAAQPFEDEVLLRNVVLPAIITTGRRRRLPHILLTMRTSTNLMQMQPQKSAWLAPHCAIGATSEHPGVHRALYAPTFRLCSAIC
jgi:hypothetical protein